MAIRATLRSIMVFVVAGTAAVAAACGSDTNTSGANPNGGNADGGDAGRDGTVSPSPGPDLFYDGSADAACVNLQCKQVQCAGGKKTTLSGTVYDPAGKIPLYNAIVYVPNGEVKPLTEGITCDQCGAVTSGNPVVTTLTGPDGKFVLENVPVGDDIPLVIQIGKWRRQLVIPFVNECGETTINDIGKTRLPRNKAEGDLPQLAIATGSVDPMECLLRKIGISDSEFTAPNEKGRVHVFTDNGASLRGGSPGASTLYDTVNTLKKYDIVILPCGGRDFDKDAADKSRIAEYTSLGGRVFTTHYGYDWVRDAPAATKFPSVATFQPGKDGDLGATSVTGLIDQTFPKGQDFAAWLSNVGASPVKGEIQIDDARWNVDKTIDPTRQWIYTTAPKATMQHMTFNVPVGVAADKQCGRVVYSDFHVVAGKTGGSDPFPQHCGSSMTLSPQEKALEFMLFDLSSCIQRDDEKPKPPPIK